ncbi:Armadillo-like helical [Corchorus capsularis]|uniref:Armadillo-like helical n=1 Tax=Corchorus capsularis TaxID=210143 RepID=A0A1R3I0R6_COCAP|nr:Armadillo-like helical [Corchorus capsularis]
MATAAIFSSLRRRRSPSLEAFLAPVDLTEVALVQTLAAISSELVSCFSNKVFFFQRRNSRSLIRKIEIFVILLEYLRDSGSGSLSSLPSTAILCFKELYLLLYRSKILLDYCAQSKARENAAATLFSLSAVHDYKKRIADEGGAVEALAGLLRVGTPRGKKDAVTALFNLSTHTDNCARMIEAGAVTALVSALGNEGVAEEAAGNSTTNRDSSFAGDVSVPMSISVPVL